MSVCSNMSSGRADMLDFASRVCQEFQRYDQYREGMVTAEQFSKALNDLGLRYGQKEVDYVMQYCNVNDNGYVNYKKLARLLDGPPSSCTSSRPQSNRGQMEYPSNVRSGRRSEAEYGSRPRCEDWCSEAGSYARYDPREQQQQYRAITPPSSRPRSNAGSELAYDHQSHRSCRSKPTMQSEYSNANQGGYSNFNHGIPTPPRSQATPKQGGYPEYPDNASDATSFRSGSLRSSPPPSSRPGSSYAGFDERDMYASPPMANNGAPSSRKNGGELDAEFIKQLFTQWDRSLLTDEQFKQELYRYLGTHPSRDIERLLVVHGPPRNLSFAKLMHTIQNTHFKFQNAPDTSPLSPEPSCSRRNEMKVKTPWGRNVPLGAVDELQGGTRADRINHVLSQFIDGITTSKQFRQQLQQCQVPLTEEIERLIRRHESGNSTKYRDYAKVIFRNDEYIGLSKVDGAVPQANSSLTAPYAASDCGSQGLGTQRDRKYAEEYSNRSSSETHRTPWATVEDLKNAKPSLEVSPSHKQLFKMPANGDIIAWSDQGSTIAPSDSASNCDGIDRDRRAAMAPNWRTNGDIIGWSTNNNEDWTQKKPTSKKIIGDSEVGKRPFGTESEDIGDHVDDSVMTNAQKHHARMRKHQALHGVLA
eukprot:gnl/MRDRNA2_/MRDRNA2_95853_c0_seq1.p1 gnl/MRDRNA2_/MRDRNA2_95853_c0~~gnl/MRDRNA2_/MRDRNA2_95853_c0_seq1.p1  ORF type:complete len:645 (+),score=98.16 gnl/MRDRNA2_/MRDRNA2_95853_c0_seq1:77-2011(+)